MPPALLYQAPASFVGVMKRSVHLVCLVFVFLNRNRRWASFCVYISCLSLLLKKREIDNYTCVSEIMPT